jgi:hypothetical protein
MAIGYYKIVQAAADDLFPRETQELAGWYTIARNSDGDESRDQIQSGDCAWSGFNNS